MEVNFIRAQKFKTELLPCQKKNVDEPSLDIATFTKLMNACALVRAKLIQ